MTNQAIWEFIKKYSIVTILIIGVLTIAISWINKSTEIKPIQVETNHEKNKEDCKKLGGDYRYSTGEEDWQNYERCNISKIIEY